MPFTVVALAITMAPVELVDLAGVSVIGSGPLHSSPYDYCCNPLPSAEPRRSRPLWRSGYRLASAGRPSTRHRRARFRRRVRHRLRRGAAPTRAGGQLPRVARRSTRGRQHRRPRAQPSRAAPPRRDDHRRGVFIVGRIVDVSQSGIAVTATRSISVDDEILIGSTPAAVVRVLPGGFAARFVEALPPTFDTTIIF